MYLRRVELKNIACFEDLSLDFVDESGEPQMLTILVGENGCGKTTLLRAMALGGIGVRSAHILVTEGQRLVRTLGHPSEGSVVLYRGEAGESTRLRIHQRDGVNLTGLTDEHDQPGLTAAYGALRRPLLPMWSRPPDPRVAHVESLFDAAVPIVGARQLVGESMPVQLLPDGPASIDLATPPPVAAFFEAVDRIAQAGSPRMRIEMASGGAPMGDLLVTVGSDSVPFEQLGDGYQAALNLVADVVYRQTKDVDADAASMLNQPGIVLIDEPDIFLHPAWQKTILKSLRTCFPNIQFIVTTHNPMTILGAAELKPKVVVLRREGDAVVADDDLPSVEGWRADQLLVGDFFGLSSALDQGTEQALTDYYALLDREYRSQKEENRFRESARRLAGLPYLMPTRDREELLERLRNGGAVDDGPADAEQRARADEAIQRALESLE